MAEIRHGRRTRKSATSSKSGCSARWKTFCPSSASNRRRIPTAKPSTTSSSSACSRAATHRGRCAGLSNGTCGSTRRGDCASLRRESRIHGAGHRNPDDIRGRHLRNTRLPVMSYFIDRRLNPKGKSLANRQRFLRRARAQIREAVQKSLKDSGVADVAKDRKIRISTKDIREPRFRLDPKKAGSRDFVLPGNTDFVPGDEIKKPQSGQGGSGKDA